MTEHDDLERRLTRWFEADALAPAPADRAQQAVEAIRDRRPRSALLAELGSAWVETGSVAAVPRVTWQVLGAVALLVLALTAGAVIVGGVGRQIPSVLPAAEGPNGLLAYASAGDIYVGDPVSGRTAAIVTGPDVDSSPMFSPDGSRVAFLRGDPWGEDASVIVVRADGSDGRVAMPAGRQQDIAFTWAPDGASLLVNHDSEPRSRTGYYAGELSLVDASGEAEPRLITPPLPRGPGGPYIVPGQVAQMFRPPHGDLILSSRIGGASISLWDADLVERGQLIPEGLEDFEHKLFSPWDLSWSPDGSMIAFGMGWGDQGPTEYGTFVMQADGTEVRRLGGGGPWSPDGSMIAFQRGCPDSGRQGAVIVVVDVASGAERVLEATAVETKYEGNVSPMPAGETDGCFGGWIQDTDGRAWDYEGWSWSPDGRSIVLLERRGTRPEVVHVESGQATELPWVADSAPSWQRVSPANPQ